MIFFYDGIDCWPMGWDDDCEGAVCIMSMKPVVFGTRKSAQRAITISAAFCRLNQALGKPANTDFTTARKSIVIRKCESAEAKGGE
jgi:hypothetical protein